jgi:hypothetical protein
MPPLDNPPPADKPPQPRAIPPGQRSRVCVSLTPWEFHLLLAQLEMRASVYAEDPDLVDVAQAFYNRIYELRAEACAP